MDAWLESNQTVSEFGQKRWMGYVNGLTLEPQKEASDDDFSMRNIYFSFSAAFQGIIHIPQSTRRPNRAGESAFPRTWVYSTSFERMRGWRESIGISMCERENAALLTLAHFLSEHSFPHSLLKAQGVSIQNVDCLRERQDKKREFKKYFNCSGKSLICRVWQQTLRQCCKEKAGERWFG